MMGGEGGRESSLPCAQPLTAAPTATTTFSYRGRGTSTGTALAGLRSACPRDC